MNCVFPSYLYRNQTIFLYILSCRSFRPVLISPAILSRRAASSVPPPVPAAFSVDREKTMTSSSFLFFAAFDAKTSPPRKRTNPWNSDSDRKMQPALQVPLGRKHHGDRPFTPKKRGGIGRVPISENRFRQQKRSFRASESSFVMRQGWLDGRWTGRTSRLSSIKHITP